jgi:hypothetical protein
MSRVPNCPGVFHDHAALSRHRHAIRVTNKQAVPYEPFEALNSTNKGCRIDFQKFCRFSKTGLFRAREKNPQIVPRQGLQEIRDIAMHFCTAAKQILSHDINSRWQIALSSVNNELLTVMKTENHAA